MNFDREDICRNGFDNAIVPFLKGTAAWGSIEACPVDEAVDALAGYALGSKGFREAEITLDGNRRKAVFMGWRTQASKLDGTGYLMVARWGSWRADKGLPAVAYRVKACTHDVRPGAGANPTRGWHPAHCATCGLDLSVDSSD